MADPTLRSNYSDRSDEIGSPEPISKKSEGERIRWRLAQLEPPRDVAWLAGKTGIPLSTMHDNLARGISKPKAAVEIAKALDVSLEWLLTGIGFLNEASKTVGYATSDGAARIKEESAAAQLGMVMIPEADITYSMGGGAIVGDYVEARMVPFREDWLNRLTRGGPADVFLTRGQGDSMMPTILDDDDVLVNRADRAIRQQDRIWAVGYGDLGMIKRVRRLPTGLFQLNSDNASVTPIEATEDEIYFVGRVIWIGRRV